MVAVSVGCGTLPITPRVKACQGDEVIEISWGDRKLEKACATDKAGVRHWGADQWALMKRRIATLMAAPTLREMDGAPGRCHALTADRAGEFAIGLWGQFRLIFVPDHDPVPRLEDGGIDQSQVTKISITEVADYHGN